MSTVVKAKARKSDPVTSHEAAGSITAVKLRESQHAVLRVLGKLRAGATDETIAEKYYEMVAFDHGYPYQSPSGLRTRRAELVKAGLVEDAGKRKRLASGRNAIVWARVKGAKWVK